MTPLEQSMISIEINGTMFCADTAEEAAALVKAFDLPFNQEWQSSQSIKNGNLAKTLKSSN
jgi:hypothetical protein